MRLYNKRIIGKIISLVLTLVMLFTMLVQTTSLAAYPLWQAGTNYKAGDIVTYGTNNYQCRQPHTAIVGWEPPNVPALWALYDGPVIPTVSTPVFNPAGGTYNQAQSVSISCATTGATIRYTTNGSEPTSTSTEYLTAITVSATTTLKAKAFMAGMTDSETATATYTISSNLQKVATPSFSPAAGTYSSQQSVTILCQTPDAIIRYTTNGSEPTSASQQYTAAIAVASTTTIKAKAFKSGMTDSDTASATYVISIQQNTSSKVIVGYWHNFDNGSTVIKLGNVSPDWDVINVAFADIAPDATVTFTPFNDTEAGFRSDIAYLNSIGKKVVLSLGGQNGALSLPDSASKSRFVNSLIATIDKYGFNGVDVDVETGISLGTGDTDFRTPVAPTIVNLIASIKEVCAKYGSNFILSMAPEIAYVQGGITAYGGPWGAYLPIIHAVRDNLTYIHVQHYNCGGNAALDGRTYNQGTADFQVAMAEMLMTGFNVAGNSNNFFPALRQDQVAIGLPACASAAGGGYTPPAEVIKALNYIIKGQSYGGTYTLANPGGYPGFRGIMTWSINWNNASGNEFINSYRPYFNQFGTSPVQTVATPQFNPAGGSYTMALSVTISCATSGATIRYTTNGTEPTSASSLYTGVINVSSTTTIKAKAFKSGMNDSATASATYSFPQIETVATPQFSPAAGTYTTPQSVTISCATTGAAIRYTTDGTEPTSASSQYTGAINVSATTTIKAKAFKSGMTDSATASATYTISQIETVATPQFSPAAGTYTTPQSVTISCATVGATIRYTTNGTEPTSASSQYTGAINVSATTTIKAKAFKSGMTDSATATAGYTIALETIQPPVFNPSGGTYTSPQTVTITCATSGAVIYYSLDGSNPTASSLQYSTPITVSTSMTIKAVALKTSLASNVVSATYVINSNSGTDAGNPTGAPVAAALTHDNWDGDGNYNISMNIWWGNNATSWKIYENNVVIYSSPIQANSPNAQSASYSVTGKANGTYTYKADLTNSFGTTSTSTISVNVTTGAPVPSVAAPAFNPAGGTYSAPQSVTLSCATSGATIRYTTDGSEPTSTSAAYSAAIAVSSGTIAIKAKAFKAGMTDSSTTSATYTIENNTIVAAPTFSPAGGTYFSPQNVAIACSTSGATIRYTTNGTEPTSASPAYSAPIAISALGTTTIKAKGFKAGLQDSSTVSASYTIAEQNLPKCLMIGYWHTWGGNNPFIKLRDVDPNWDVINIAFTEPVTPGSSDGRMKFEIPGMSTVTNYTINDFKADVKMWQSRGKKVVLSIGGYEGWFYLGSTSAISQFVNDIKGFVNEYGFDGIDIDLEQDSIIFNQGNDPFYKNPTSPRIVNMISAIRQICDSYGPNFILSWAPETFYMQNGIQYYAGIHQFCLAKAGCYIPLIHALRDKTTYVHVQLYNSNPMMGNDGQLYNMGTVEGIIAMCEMLIDGFKIMGKDGPDYFFDPLRPDQVVIGVPASPSAAGSGQIPNSGLQQAFRTLIAKYPALRGIMTWSINWDSSQNNNSFVRENRAFLNTLP